MQVQRRGLVVWCRHPPLPARPLVCPRRLQPGRRSSRLAAARIGSLPLHRRQPGRRPVPYGRHLRPHPYLLLASPPPLAKSPLVWRGQTHLAGSRYRRPAPRRQPLLLCLHPSGHPRAPAHPPHPARSPLRLVRHTGAGKRSHSLARPPLFRGPHTRTWPARPPYGPDPDHCPVPVSRCRMDTLGSRGISPSPVPPPRASRPPSCPAHLPLLLP